MADSVSVSCLELLSLFKALFGTGELYEGTAMMNLNAEVQIPIHLSVKSLI